MRLLIFGLMFLHQTAHAITGNELHDLLQSEDTYKSMQGMSYLQGYSDAESFFKYFESSSAQEQNRKPNLHFFSCPPENVTVGQAKDVVKKFLEDNPAKRNINAAILMRRAFTEAWPCSD